MTIDELCQRIDERLVDMREEGDRLKAALDALGPGAGETTLVDIGLRVALPRRQAAPRRQAPQVRTREVLLSAVAGSDAMDAAPPPPSSATAAPTGDPSAGESESPAVIALRRELDAGLRVRI